MILSFSRFRSNLEKWTAGREDELVHVKLLAVLAGQAQVRVLLIHPQLPASRPNEKSVLRKGDRLSPEVALCVLLELLPVEPVLVRPHPDLNLLQYFSTSVCLYVGPAPQVSAGGRVCGGKHSLKGSSLQGQSQKKTTRIHASSFTEQSNRPPLCSVFCLKKVVTLVHCSVFSTANPFRELSRFGW